jgi:phosphohistidine swiveling domain-containing protein
MRSASALLVRLARLHDLSYILMIKSERDVREAFTQSLSQATEENRKALDQLADAFESIKATGVSVAGSLLEALKPAIEEGAVRLAEWAVQLGEFTKDLQAAGGGLQGFQETLDKNAPELGAILRTLTDVLSVVVNRFRDTGTALRNLWSWITYYLNKVRAPWGSQGVADDIGQRVSNATGGRGILGAAADWWRQTVADNRARDIAEGRARIVLTPDELDQVQDGEILVAPVTNTSWTPVFSRIKAAVSDIGGIMCHAAIVSREYGLPAVVGTGFGTTTIKTGMLIRVDGDTGKVTILEDA